ncbi:DUF2236 domain-containing protein [Natronosporangium hydrolyticum]|uniref:DUF2236 domain-containing protein n=1 Tax=Natronosporangium hydrolyticum TaxID=2811111 RepID=A0A895YNG1_9ACTN|nr:oxygenase MpaB family protein [Natronosporangium hydrolyticum]QSB17485.1 DUF2236 domain-containing protein [Natronosporangium hydrolyticum]
MGLFGPGSVTWRVHDEPILALGGLRALFLQALHPRAIAGVVQNSGYKADPWGRLFRTITYVATTIYGTTDEAQAAGRRVRAVHQRMYATDPISGQRFRVDEPELLRWVHVTEVDSYATTARRAGLQLTDDEWDGYWSEQRRRAPLVGLDPTSVPGTATDAAAYLAEVRPELKMTRDAADTLVFLSVPPPPWRPAAGATGQSWRRRTLTMLGSGPFRAASFGIALTAFSLLPPWARRLYGGLGLPTTDLGATVSARSLRLVLNSMPHRWYEGPLYQAAMARAAAAAPTPS